MTDSVSQQPPAPPPKSPARRRRGLVHSQDIYAAPLNADASGDLAPADVTVSTLQRKPRVYLTAPPTVAHVDLPRFMGRWYEIARLPYFTQRRCVDTVYADYRLDTDGMIYVTNTCRHRDGKFSHAKGLARLITPADTARLQISFRMLYGVYVFWDDYWIIGWGEANDYALVGDPMRRRGWLLARQPRPAEVVIQTWLDEFRDKGFAINDFVRTPQLVDVMPNPPAAR